MEITSIADCIHCRTRAGEEQAPLPALLTFERVRNLRFPSIRSKQGEVQVRSAEDIGADPDKIGLEGSPTRVVRSFESSRGKRKCKLIRPEELKSVIADARSKPGAFAPPETSTCLLKNVMAIGERAAQVAKTVSDDITVLPRDSAEALASVIRQKQPYAVLWPADLWGRKTAPVVQAMLGTGLVPIAPIWKPMETPYLCIAPLRAGVSQPRLFAVPNRLWQPCAPARKPAIFLVGMGLGAADAMSHLLPMIEKNGAVPAASRALVDRGLAPYEWQVGLTGKTVAPKVYLALGISGAVQHTCGFESAETVIAVNTDPKAEIFEYADFGLILPLKTVIFK